MYLPAKNTKLTVELASVDLTHGSEEVSVVSADSLSSRERECWASIRAANPDLSSPFFAFEYIEGVARFCDGIKVAILYRDGDAFAFWPFHEIKPGVAGPVGGKIGCMQGVICSRDTQLDGMMLASSCGLHTWKFDHLLASQETFSPFLFDTLESRYMDLSRGFDAYRKERAEAGHSNKAIRNGLASGRKLGREVGEIRFDPDCKDPAMLRQLIGWKQRQMRDTGIGDLFARCPWIEPFVESTLSSDGDSFRGVLSVLYSDDIPIAAQFGFFSEGALHGIFLSFDRKFHRYSPGMVLLLEMAKHAQESGIKRIDLGKGGEPFKKRLMSTSTVVGVGALESRPINAFLRSSGFALKKGVISAGIDRPIRSARRLMGRLRYRLS
tara:strand:- start:4222 stop:5367 length:1146 start_codon:yes stop_codon:yes gene_type:complete